MISVLICAAQIAAGQATVTTAPEHEFVCRVRVVNTKGLIAMPKVRTQDNQRARVTIAAGGKRTFEIEMLPHLEENGTVSTGLGFSVNGAEAAGLISHSKSNTTTTYFRVTPLEQHGTKLIVVNALDQAPDIKSDEYAVSVTATLAGNDFSDLFKPRQATAQGGTPRQILYEVELSDSKHVIAKPKVRTLDGMPALISQSGSEGSYDVRLLPSITRDGKLSTLMLVTVDSEDVFTMSGIVTPKKPMTFKVVSDNHGLTKRVVGETGRRNHHLKPGDLLIKLSASIIQE